MLRRTISVALVLWAVAFAAPTRTDDNQVDLLLVLAADISRSVDAKKFALQREGYATAISDPAVIRAMTAGPNRRIALCFLEWADDYEQRVMVDWALIAGSADADSIANRIGQAPRLYQGRTSIGAGIDYAMAQFARTAFRADRRVIDVSGDGTNNADRDVRKARDEAVAQGVTINGLVIVGDGPLSTNPRHTHPAEGLAVYYERNVIGGAGAFVLEAQDFDAFGKALTSKLLKEIASDMDNSATRLASAH